MVKEKNLDDALHLMNDLIEMQQEALETSNELFKLKDARLDVVDRLITIYKQENRMLKICFCLLVVLNIITTIISFL